MNTRYPRSTCMPTHIYDAHSHRVQKQSVGCSLSFSMTLVEMRLCGCKIVHSNFPSKRLAWIPTISQPAAAVLKRLFSESAVRSLTFYVKQTSKQKYIISSVSSANISSAIIATFAINLHHAHPNIQEKNRGFLLRLRSLNANDIDSVSMDPPSSKHQSNYLRVHPL